MPLEHYEGATVIRNWISLRSDIYRLGRELYRAGAPVVLPAGLPGCLPIPGTSGQNTPV